MQGVQEGLGIGQDHHLFPWVVQKEINWLFVLAFGNIISVSEAAQKNGGLLNHPIWKAEKMTRIALFIVTGDSEGRT